MGWRKIEQGDLKLGLVIHIVGMTENGSFGMCTVIAIHDDSIHDKSYKHIKVARPYAYAPFADVNCNQPLLGAEVFPIGLNALFQSSDYQVYEDRHGLRTSTVNPV